MSKAIPSKEEITKAIILNVFTAAIGVVIGMLITNAWEVHKDKSQQLTGYGRSIDQI